MWVPERRRQQTVQQHEDQAGVCYPRFTLFWDMLQLASDLPRLEKPKSDQRVADHHASQLKPFVTFLCPNWAIGRTRVVSFW